MKKAKLTGKLSLKKETLARLNGDQLGHVHGGDPTYTVDTTVVVCPTHLQCHTRIVRQCHITLPFCPTETCGG